MSLSTRPLLALAAAAVTLLGVTAAVHADGGASFSLQPVTYDASMPATQSYFIFDASLGQTLQSAVRVTNSGTAAGTVRLYPVDATTGQTSGTVYLGHDAPRTDAGAWITLGADELTLKPGESANVPFTVQVPADTRAGQHVAGIVGENEELTKGAAGSLQVNIQNLTITAVQVNLAGPVVEKVEVSGVRADGQNGYQTLVVSLRNTGTDLLKPSGTLTVSDSEGRQVQQIPLALDTVLPGTGIDYPTFVQNQALDVGQYRASVDLTYGNGGHTQYSGTFSVTATQIQQVFQGQAPLTRQQQAQGASATGPGASARSASGSSLPVLPLAGLGVAVVGVLVLGFSLYARQRSTA